MKRKYLWWLVAILTVFALVAMPAFARRGDDDHRDRGRYTDRNTYVNRNDDDDGYRYDFRGNRYEYRVVVRRQAKLAALEFIEQYLDRVVQEAVRAIQNADSYEQMLKIAERVDRIVRSMLEKLESKLGPGEVEAFEITVCNEKVGRCVTFDPIHLCGFR